ncbi:MAG: hypothetical protein K0Q72_1586 [Armatimonadetes bacterium]|nr:hypothetical protein [Armatimonadota bacterium]
MQNETNQPVTELLFEPAAPSEEADGRSYPPSPDCLTFARARMLALDASRSTGDEDRHSAGCRRCARMRDLIEREMPHLSTWVLIRKRLGLPLFPAEQHMVAYHLKAGGCRDCAQREAALTDRFPKVVVLGGVLPVPLSRAVGASTPPVSAGGHSADGTLEVEVVLERGRMGLELRTQSPRWRHQLVGWTLATRREREADERFAVLQADVEGWFVDHAWLDVKRLRLGPQNRCEEILAAALELEHLSAPQRQRLLQSVRDASAEQLADWRHWAAEQSERAGLEAGDQKLLTQVLELARAS